MAERDRNTADFPAAFESAFAELRGRIEAAAGDERRAWPERVAAGIRAACDFGVERPRQSKLLTLDALAEGERGRDLYERMVTHFAEQLRLARGGEADGEPATLESAAVGGVALLLIRRAGNGHLVDLPAMAPDAIQFVLAPYIGVEEAERVAAAGR